MGRGYVPLRHVVISIGAEYGSGGPEIGRMVADDLGIACYDRDAVDRAAGELDGGAASADPARAQFAAVRELAAHSCVIVGRCGNYILEGVADCLNIFIYAPLELRVQSIMEEEHLSEKKALETLRARDRQLHDRYKRVTGTSRSDRRYRDLMIDSSVLGWARTARLIETFVLMAREQQ